ncbi:hypothetical protein F5X99DRAFT_320042 [Biscogniauxia marginata]|nr:hypothetical protein F5X99DRAFT_320042 [Biscogniauxia marginata]
MLPRPSIIPMVPLRALTVRRFRPTSSSSLSIPPQRTWARFSSQQPSSANSGSASAKPPSLNAQFYRTFGRPMAKTILLAIFTYQLAYYLWVKLEHDEIKAEMQGE